MHDPRLQTDRNVWLATVRPNGKPHLIPIWFVWHAEKFYICTEGKSVKIKNLKANPLVCVSLEDGNKPVIAEGTAALIERPYPDDVAALFQQKYNWNINTDTSYTVLIEIAPQKWLNWQS
jgi:PPOX class probable F420-dependent enzyme